MTTYSSTQLTARKPVPGFGAGGGQIRTQHAVMTVPASATTSDIFKLFYLPKHARVMGGWLKTADLDTTTNVTLNVGDTGGYDDAGVAITADNDRYFAAYSGQAAAATTVLDKAGLGFYTGARGVLVQMVLAAGPSTTAGDVEVCIFYTVEEPQ
jgi:hypothetical protein